ncbi:MAG TPA: HD domain-containing phosphohydrolase [Longimicrobium sp.]|nr:HD domain-containing phosphohydrolase [Longimicrobium sp.]
MNLLNSIFGSPHREPPSVLQDAEDEAALAAASALMVALERRDDELGLARHCARVAMLADRLAAHQGVEPELRAVLRHAALLHEVGMIGVPAALLRKTEVLTRDELEIVHRQAELGAEIARSVCGPVGATLIRHQYDDYATLRDLLADEEILVLAGILRTADVVEAITRPRPYQPPLPLATRRALLRSGAGSLFDPGSVDAYLSKGE